MQSPKSDIYVALLGIALGAILLSCLLMAMLFGRYGFSTKTSATTSATPPTAIA